MLNSGETEKSTCISPPPPYTPQVDPDFPQFDTPSSPNCASGIVVQSNPTSPSEKKSKSGILKTPPPTPQLGDAPENPTESYQNDIFQRPPKFLLYPTVAEPVLESAKFKDGVPAAQPPVSPMTAGVGHRQVQQQPHRVPAAFAVPNNQNAQSQPNMTPHQGPFPTNSYMPRHSHRAVCPYCQISVITETEYVAGTLTHLIAFGLMWVSCCCCIPYFINDLKDVEHYCRHCNHLLGYHHKRVF